MERMDLLDGSTAAMLALLSAEQGAAMMHALSVTSAKA